MTDVPPAAPRPTVAPALGVGVAPRRQRRWSLALVAALVVLGSALAFAVLWMNAGDRKPVLALARDVDAGEVLTDGDLEVVRVAADPGVVLVPSDARAEVVGQTAVSDLVAGSLLTRGQLGEGSTLDEGKAVVGVAVDPGKLPTPDLRTGNRVAIVQTGSAAADAGGDDESDAPALGVTIAEGVVHGLDRGDELGGNVLVSVLVDEADAPRIAGAAASGEASLVLIP